MQDLQKTMAKLASAMRELAEQMQEQKKTDKVPQDRGNGYYDMFGPPALADNGGKDKLISSVGRPPSELKIDKDDFAPQSQKLIISLNSKVKKSMSHSLAVGGVGPDPVGIAVIYLLGRYTKIDQRTIANAYEITEDTVYDIINSRTWTSVTDQIRQQNVSAHSLWDDEGKSFRIKLES